MGQVKNGKQKILTILHYIKRVTSEIVTEWKARLFCSKQNEMKLINNFPSEKNLFMV